MSKHTCVRLETYSLLADISVYTHAARLRSDKKCVFLCVCVDGFFMEQSYMLWMALIDKEVWPLGGVAG